MNTVGSGGANYKKDVLGASRGTRSIINQIILEGCLKRNYIRKMSSGVKWERLILLATIVSNNCSLIISK